MTFQRKKKIGFKAKKKEKLFLTLRNNFIEKKINQKLLLSKIYEKKLKKLLKIAKVFYFDFVH
jgi:hypothetical protein